MGDVYRGGGESGGLQSCGDANGEVAGVVTAVDGLELVFDVPTEEALDEDVVRLARGRTMASMGSELALRLTRATVVPSMVFG